ncbi:MAG: DUF983 domain-containing protein [Pseudonocardiaceae bacterium]
MIGRALRLRCPLCGVGGIWRAFGQLVDRCPGCGYAFEREEGYWTGGLIVNYTMAMAALLVILVAGWIRYGATLPVGVMVLAAATMIVLPILGYPWSKTLWIVVDLRINPYTDEERPEVRHDPGSCDPENDG